MDWLFQKYHTHQAMVSAICLAVMCICSQVQAQESPQANESTEELAGDAYFEFAFRDKANIIQQGELGGPRSDAVAQQTESPDNSDDDEAEDLPEDAPDSAENNPEQDQDEPAGEGLNAAQFKRNALPGDHTMRISDIELHCEDLEFCQDKENVEALIRATDLELGHLTTNTDLALAIERLRKTGYFSNIHQTLQHDGDRVAVSFTTVPHTTIRKVIIDESGSLYKSEVKKRMILRPGGALYPRTAILRGMDVDDIPKEKLIQMAIEDQVKSLTRVYNKEGYFDAKVTITTEEIEPNLVDLHVTVENAESYVLGKVYVRGHHVKTYAEIESAFRSEFGFFGGVTKAEIEDAVEAVLNQYRQDGYYQTSISFVSRQVPEKKTVDVFLDITESPLWSVQLEGNESLSEKELRTALTFEASGYVDKSEVEASATALKQTYISAGYYWAKVSGEMLQSGDNTVNIIVFNIDEGERAEIGEIQFAGAFSISRDELLDIIDSTEYSAFGSGAYPQRSMIADDAAKIVDLYRERGYLSADVPSWTLAPIENSNRLRLTFIISEGPQSKLSHRQIRYADRETYDAFDVLIDRPVDDVFSDSSFRAERAAITKQLRARGHATIADRVLCTSYDEDGVVSSEETCEIADFPATCFPDDIDAMCEITETPNGPQERCMRHFETEYGMPDEPPCVLQNGITGSEVDVEYGITLGPRFAFGDVFVHGNVVTRNWVVKQDIPFTTGETFDINKVIDARSLLRRRTIYKSASLNVIGVDDNLTSTLEKGDSTSTTEYPVPMVVNLEEGERRWIDFALGIQETGGDWILTGEMEFVEANLLGTGWDLRFLLMPEARFLNESTEFVFTQKFNQNFFTLLTLSIPIFPAKGFNLVTQLFYDLRYIPDTNKEEYGWLVELQWNVSKAWFAALAFELESSRTSSFGIDVSDDISSYHACYPVTFFQDCPFSAINDTLTVSLTPRASYDGRDNPLTPKYGFYAEGKVKLVYSNTIGFYAKPEARASYLHTFWKFFTLAFNLRFGVSFLKSNASLPLIDRYFLGGLNMRGYDNEALGPRLVNDLTPNVATNEAGGGEVLFNFTTELRYPIWSDVGLYGALFVDMGSLTPYQPTYYSAEGFAEELFVEQMRYTAGLGLRWLINEAIPPIVIDYGFILNRRRGDPLGGFSLNVGYTF
ncbi:MAG: BamA/TamA family outer membrane protein [Proteobacteria bacterium]|nr:BamA/TamA family outer membrane protein [Pseudomonadota bacterium]